MLKHFKFSFPNNIICTLSSRLIRIIFKLFIFYIRASTTKVKSPTFSALSLVD